MDFAYSINSKHQMRLSNIRKSRKDKSKYTC